MCVWPRRDDEMDEGEDCCCCVVDIVEREAIFEGEPVDSDMCAPCDPVELDVWVKYSYAAEFSLSNGVAVFGFKIGEDVEVAVTEAVVIPISVVVTIVSISGDVSEIVVSVEKFPVGVCIVVVGVVAPDVDNFLSNWLWFAAGADEEPPRQGKQQRNSVEFPTMPMRNLWVEFLFCS